MQNILIFYGGKSTEHDVSIITALQFREKFSDDKYNVKLCYISRENRFYMGDNLELFDSYRNFDKTLFKEVIFLPGNNGVFEIKKEKKIKKIFNVDFAFNCCHGGIGEGGELAGMCVMSGITLSSAGHTALGITYDKVFTKKIAESSEIPTIPYIVLNRNMWREDREIALSVVSRFGYPVVVKPARQGSSVGVGFASSEGEFVHCMRVALEFDDKILVEKAIVNKREFNVSCIGTIDEPVVSEIEEVYSSGIMTFCDKYSGGKKGGCIKSAAPGNELKRDFPAKLTKKQAAIIKGLARKAFILFELLGIVRFDFIMDVSDDKIYLSEINTIPGSMSTYFWEKVDIPSMVISAGTKYLEQQNKRRREIDVHLI